MNGRGDFRFAAFLLSAMLGASGCGGGGSTKPITIITAGPKAILNGGSISSANSHWSSNCATQVELTADSGFRWAVSDTSGTTSSGGATWSSSANNGAVINFGGTGLGGFFTVTALTNISGSTSSKQFTAGVTVADSNGQQDLGTCSFTLQTGVIP